MLPCEGWLDMQQVPVDASRPSCSLIFPIPLPLATPVLPTVTLVVRKTEAKDKVKNRASEVKVRRAIVTDATETPNSVRQQNRKKREKDYSMTE